MGSNFNDRRVLSGTDLHGKRVLVTGVSAGIGVETARALAAHGAHVTGAARDLEKAAAATAQVRKDAAANGGSFELVALDLASLKSVRACGDGLLARGDGFDVVIANAGVMKDGGRIILIGSNTAVRTAFPGSSVYSLTKAALTGLVRGAAIDLAPRTITVNNVQPGPTATDMETEPH